MRANSLSAAGSFLLAALVSGCGSSGDSSPVLQAAPAATESVVAPVLSRSDSRPTAGATGDENVLPVVLVHGMSGDPLAWGPILDPLERGRTVFRECYADDLAELAPGSVSRSSVFAIGYYKRRQSDDLYHGGRCSIGGCPVPRTDGKAGYYSVAYADVVDDAIEAILRATGAPRVDLCGISLGGVISRAYVKWRSARGPGGESRVRRLILLESPTRGVNDLEALMLSLDTMPFQRWGEVAELARDYPGWDGKSYISRLNDGFDAWCAAHGVSYGGLYGTGHCVFNLGNLDRAIHAAQQVLDGGGSDLGNAPPATPESPPSLAAMPEVSSSDAPAPSPPSRGVGPDSVLDAIQDGLIFIDPSRLDIEKCVVEALGDGDGFVRASS
ncbi:hypothetical protein HY251_00325, partial [bacterium]|nr:hypothetical protein [bacterium]